MIRARRMATREGHERDAGEAGTPYERGKRVRRRKAANRFDEVAIGLRVVCNDPPERGDHVEGVEIVEPVQAGYVDLRKFET